MYTIEEFDREKTKVIKYVLYKKRTEKEIKAKFKAQIEENMLEEEVLTDLISFTLHGDEFYVENESLVRADHATGTLRTVGKSGRNEQTPFCAGFHELECFDPSGNNLSYTESSGFATIDAGIEYGAVDEFAPIQGATLKALYIFL